MKRQKQICRNCGYEETVERYPAREEQEEARRRGIPLGRPRCSKCGSDNVIHHD